MIKKDKFVGNMLRLAMPIAIQNLLTSCAQMIDTAMVVKLGNVATAAVGVAFRWGFLLNVVLFGICSGACSLTSQFWGAREHNGVRKSFGIALILCVGIGLIYNFCTVCFPQALMSVFSNEADVISVGSEYLRTVGFYGIFVSVCAVTGAVLRSCEDVFTPLISSSAAVIINTCLNYVLIYGKLGFKAYGVKGAAMATVISAAVQMCFYVIICTLRKSFLFTKPREIFALDRTFVKTYILVALPVLLNESGWAIGTNMYSMVFARQGNENYAAFTLFESIEQIVFVFFVGICNASSIMIGKTIGEGDDGKAKNLARRFLIMTPLIAVVVSAFFIIIRNPLISLFPIETEGARTITSSLLLIYCIWLPIRMIPYTAIVGIFRAGGDTKAGFFYDNINIFFVAVPLVFILGFVIKANFLTIFIAMYLGEDTIKTVMCLKHVFSYKWIKHLYSEQSTEDKTDKEHIADCASGD